MIIFLWSLIVMGLLGSCFLIVLSMAPPSRPLDTTMGGFGILGIVFCFILSVGILVGTHLDGRDFRGNKLTSEATR